MISNLEKIISDTKASPTIVNKSSNFVVTTYWWGRGNLNSNTARPCVAFYETFFNSIKNLGLNILNTTIDFIKDKSLIKDFATKKSATKKSTIKTSATKTSATKIDTSIETIANNLLENLEIIIYKSKDYENLTRRKAKAYMEDIYNYTLDYSEKNKSEENKNIAAINNIEKFKKSGKTPSSYEFKDIDYVQTQFKIAGLLFIIKNKANILQLFKLNHEVKELKNKYLNEEKLSIAEIKA